MKSNTVLDASPWIVGADECTTPPTVSVRVNTSEAESPRVTGPSSRVLAVLRSEAAWIAPNPAEILPEDRLPTVVSAEFVDESVKIVPVSSGTTKPRTVVGCFTIRARALRHITILPEWCSRLAL